jgi:hypothetical protein
MKTIKDNNSETLAIIIESQDHLKKDGISFWSDPSWDLQFASMNHSTGHEISRHFHPKQERNILNTTEILVLLEGEVEATFYDNNLNFIANHTLATGDVLILLSGGHGFNVKREARFFEIKQGPFSAEKDKVHF